MTAGLRIAVAELLGRPGASRRVSGTFELSGLELEHTGTTADQQVVVELDIATIVEGLSVIGDVRGRWRAECRRCLEPVSGQIAVAVSEVFEEDASEGETWPIEAEHIDLEPLVREAVMLSLPLSPLCGPDCVGPDPERFPTTGVEDQTPAKDPRWAALDDLDL